MSLISKINDAFVQLTQLVKLNSKAIDKRVRVDSPQALTTVEQSQGRTNLGLGAVATQSTVSIVNGGTGATTLAEAQEAMGINDNKVLNPIKIGSKWYQSGLRYSAEYPRDYNPTTMTALSGYQMWVPFVALENATINNLEIQCTTAVASSTVQLGLYSSDANNDLSGAIFISGAISCATTGAKIAPCSIAIQKGKVYWLSSLTTGTPSFNRSYSDSLQAIKGAVNAGQPNVVGYAIANMTTMPVTPPTNKVDRNGAVPRVAFSTL